MRNRLGTSTLIVLLMVSAWGALPRARADAQLWLRLRQLGRVAPDTDWDRSYATLTTFLPPHAIVGLVQSAPVGSPQREREYYFLQYSLAPRLVDPSNRPEFLVVCPPSAAATLIDSTRYAVVTTVADDFGLYRRIEQ